MISRLLERARRRAETGDLALKTDETLTLSFDTAGLASAEVSATQGVNLRVVVAGRAGCAGSTGDDPEALLEAAMASARLGEPAGFVLPRVAEPGRVVTHYPRAAAASLNDLALLGHLVRDRLAGEGAQVRVVVERSVGSVRVANTRGLDAGYDVSRVTIAAQVAVQAGGRLLRLSDQLSSGDVPDLPSLERMVDGLLRRLRWAARPQESPRGHAPVCFAGDAALALLLPLQQALVGKAALYGLSPLGGRRGHRALGEQFTLSDEPLLDGRPGSRPIDDEGTPSRSTMLIRHGTVETLVYDLETAARAGVAPTGHGRRTVFGKPHAAFSNLVVAPGALSPQGVLEAVGDGLLVESFVGPGQGSVAGGTFSLPCAVAWRVRGGEVTGVAEELTLAGNAYELLNRLRGLGTEHRWVGSLGVPPIVVEGVSVLGPS
ncbi:MAG TPA: TldD/PmbA family protein [Gemmatimonadales bacterium]|nr:TldD/PmbA family protein [Gemmatimonadales bacterium]